MLDLTAWDGITGAKGKNSIGCNNSMDGDSVLRQRTGLIGADHRCTVNTRGGEKEGDGVG